MPELDVRNSASSGQNDFRPLFSDHVDACAGPTPDVCVIAEFELHPARQHERIDAVGVANRR
ncbi:hypothetical protein [Curtobacterium sp. MCBD17_040]|uniref:hypothetical protein n=1 Tax=Curtobacterium sp. MCBD17_040 TaxID=2175674 RepID=UPI0011B54572|nr:hypothetical protein [Curtobacterium sp. MCBD17_040]WIB62985.1 hypothetical protein DEI94_12600 [Curtobacterium sp. MCBD17_040]